jgi:glycosyltransferase involved in cell wall biosynthesis
MSEAVDVSVLVITYNHERFIGRTLDSVLAQRGTTFEIIVSEDRSTDRTLEIVRDKLAGRADVRIIASQENLGCNATILRAIRAARGRYVAMIDGDDFWTVDDRLARQIALLDTSPEVSACFHNALIIRDDGDQPTDERWTPATQPARIGLAELWDGNPFATCAGMMRREALDKLGDWYAVLGKAPNTAMVTDWPLYLACAEHGDLAFIDEPVGAYRLHDASCYSSLPGGRKLDITAELYRRMDAGLGHRHHASATAGAARYFSSWMSEYAASGERSLARRAARHAFRSGGIGRAVGWRRWLGQTARALR